MTWILETHERIYLGADGPTRNINLAQAFAEESDAERAQEAEAKAGRCWDKAILMGHVRAVRMPEGGLELASTGERSVPGGYVESLPIDVDFFAPVGGSFLPLRDVPSTPTKFHNLKPGSECHGQTELRAWRLFGAEVMPLLEDLLAAQGDSPDARTLKLQHALADLRSLPANK